MIQKIFKIGFIGSGLSTLSLLSLLNKQSIKNKKDKFYFCVLQKQTRLSGRVYSYVLNKIANKQQFDLGANLIDYQQLQDQQLIKNNTQKSILSNIIPFKKDFKIYENNKLRLGDYYKQRYYYKQGFNKFVNDIIQQIDKNDLNLQFKTNSQVVKIQKINQNNQNKWQVSYLNNNIISKQKFDKIVITNPSINLVNHIYNFQHIKLLQQYVKLSKYTKQITVVFKVNHNSNHLDFLDFSCILFKNHPITFICSHQQKYPNNSQIYLVMQTNIQFSQQYFEKEQKQITQILYQSIPEEMKEKYKIINEHVFVHKWNQSLLIPLNKTDSENHKKIVKNLRQIEFLQGIYIIGDSTLQKSRVTNAIKSGYQGSNRLLKNIQKQIKSKL